MREFPRYFYKRQGCEVLVLALLCFIKIAWNLAHFGRKKSPFRRALKETQLFGKHTHIYSNAFSLRPRQEQCVKQTDRLEIAKVDIKVTHGI